MVDFHDRSDESMYEIVAQDDGGSKYHVKGVDSKTAGHGLAHCLATGAVPRGAAIVKKGPLVRYSPNRG